MNLDVWAGRVFRAVEADGQAVARVRLMASDGSIWHTWEPPLPAPGEWSQEAEAVLDELARELPPRKHAIVFVAEDAGGGVMSQCPRTIAGLNRAAGDTQRAERQAVTDAMSAIAKTTDNLLNSANVQIATLTKTVETLGQKHSDALDLIVALQEQAALQRQQGAVITGDQVVSMVSQVVENFPSIMQQLAKAKRGALAKRQPEPPVGANGKGLKNADPTEP